MPAPDLFHLTGLCASKSQARRLIQQQGAYVNNLPVASQDALISTADLVDGAIVLRAGKKRYHRVTVE